MEKRMDLQGKRLLILGGSRISGEIVRRARAMGITTGVTDWYPVERSPAKQEADEAYVVSTSDIDAMAALIRDKRFDGVVTGFTDSVLPYYADICARTGLPAYGTREQFEIFLNKRKYKDLMRTFDVPTVPEYRIDPDRFEETAESVVYPVLVKPGDSSGSRGISVCRNREELRAALAVAERASERKEVLVEQYLDAPEASIFWQFAGGEYHVTLLGNRYVKNSQPGALPQLVGYTFPSALTPRFLAEDRPKMEAMFRSVGLRDGMMFMQCKVVDGRCLVYDIGYRLTGSIEYHTLRAMCGFDPLEMLIRFALTGDAGEPELARKADPYLGGKYAYNVTLLSRPGKIAEIRGLEEVRALPGVTHVLVSHPAGEEITEGMRGLLAQITVRVLGQADSIPAMRRDMLRIHDMIRILDPAGNDLGLPGVTEADFDGVIYEP